MIQADNGSGKLTPNNRRKQNKSVASTVKLPKDAKEEDQRAEQATSPLAGAAPRFTRFMSSLPSPHAIFYPQIPGYEILSELGRGGMGVVYKARQHGLKRIVALKMISGNGLIDAESHARFQAEAEAVARLHHPNIVQIYSIGAMENRLTPALTQPYFVLEYVGGGNLRDWMQRCLYEPCMALWHCLPAANKSPLTFIRAAPVAAKQIHSVDTCI